MAAQQRINVVRIAFVHYQHPDLAKATQFLQDFGLQIAKKDEGRLYFAGYGIDPFCYIAEQSPKQQRSFLGGTWAVASEADLEVAASHPTASAVEIFNGPGGGKRVTITDPNGISVSFIHGQELKQPSSIDEITNDLNDQIGQINSARQKPRQGAFRRFAMGPSPVHQAGHFGVVVPESKFQESSDFYTSLMNLKPTDSVFDPKTNANKTTFFHIDQGQEYTDHHSFFLAMGRDDEPAHVHHASFEVNDFDSQSLGHDWLEKKGYVNCWGIGRHVLGSQIFDYWFDASGNVLEHYSDGDLVNENTPWERHPESPNSLYIWGPNIPLAFVTGRVADAGVALPVPPQELPDVSVAH